MTINEVGNEGERDMIVDATRFKLDFTFFILLNFRSLTIKNAKASTSRPSPLSVSVLDTRACAPYIIRMSRFIPETPNLFIYIGAILRPKSLRPHLRVPSKSIRLSSMHIKDDNMEL